jgi:hypothetical protein
LVEIATTSFSKKNGMLKRRSEKTRQILQHKSSFTLAKFAKIMTG